MIPTSNDSDSLLLIVSQKGLFQDLLDQIRKDFELAGLSISIENTIKSDELPTLLYSSIQQLVLHNFEGYLQLLYRVDIPERSMRSDEIQDVNRIAKKATFLILRREWEKVYYRDKFA